MKSYMKPYKAYEVWEGDKLYFKGSCYDIADHFGFSASIVGQFCHRYKQYGYKYRDKYIFKPTDDIVYNERFYADKNPRRTKLKMALEKQRLSEPSRLDNICMTLLKHNNRALADDDDFEKIRQEVEERGIHCKVVEYENHYHLEVV